jgi:hypothetical protein
LKRAPIGRMYENRHPPSALVLVDVTVFVDPKLGI